MSREDGVWADEKTGAMNKAIKNTARKNILFDAMPKDKISRRYREILFLFLKSVYFFLNGFCLRLDQS